MTKNKKALPAQSSLIGKKVFLRPATPEDEINFQYWFLQLEPQSMTCHPLPFKTVSEVSEASKKKEKSPYRQIFTIIKKEDKRPVGKITFFNYNTLNRSAELGILIDPDEHKNGYAKDAMKVLIKYLFRYRDLNKVYCQTAEFNSASIKLLESLGFEKDGTLRDHHFYDGEFHSDFIYSLVRFDLSW
ncbi:MAG: GNAT family N-acetyltransferase [Candidatus Zixiibacteriota bacterium]